MRSGGRDGGNVREGAISLILAMLMTSGAVLALAPFIGPTIVAPPTAGTLDVTFYDIAPDTHTFPGDENVTMMWIDMTASGGDVQVYALDFTLGGTATSSEITNIVLWDDSTGIAGPDKLQGYSECELANDTNPSGATTLPTSGNLQNCGVPGGDFVVLQSQTRYILVFISISPTATEGNTISITLDAMSTDGTVIGGAGMSGTIQILQVIFSDDMESGQGGWTTSGNDRLGNYPGGLWHLSSGEEDCTNNVFKQKFHHSSVTGWWYGHRHPHPLNPAETVCSYWTSAPGDPLNATKNWGNLTSPEIDATTASSLHLTFWHMLSGEPDTGIYKIDNGHLWVYDGTWHKISKYTDGYDITDNSWWKETYNLSAFAGKFIKLEFRFDTVDGMNNMWLGWFIDDVTVYGGQPIHPLIITDNDLVPVISLPTKGGPYTYPVTARISNVGANNETQVLVNMTVDGNFENQTTVWSLGSGNSVVLFMGWVVRTEGVHEICLEAWATSGATSLPSCRSTTVISIKPRDLQVYKSANTLMLEWLEPTLPTFQGYRIYRSTTVNGFDFMNVYGTAPAGATQWLDPQADAGTDANNYFYILRAFDSLGDEENNTNKVGKFVNQLHVGTNDISVGSELSDNAMSTVFESVDGLTDGQVEKEFI